MAPSNPVSNVNINPRAGRPRLSHERRASNDNQPLPETTSVNKNSEVNVRHVIIRNAESLGPRRPAVTVNSSSDRRRSSERPLMPTQPMTSSSLSTETGGSSPEEALSIATQSSLDLHDAQTSKSSWGHITLLLVSEYVGYATLCMPWVFSTMGWVLATLSLILNVVLYTAASHVLWQFCIRHPEVRDIVELVAVLTKEKGKLGQLCKYVTSVYFYAITIAVMAFHIVSGAEYIDIVSHHWTPACKNIALSVLAVIPCFLISLIRSFPLLSKMSLFAGACTYVSLIVVCVFLSDQEKSSGSGMALGKPTVSPFPESGTTIVSFMIASLTVSFAMNASVTIPTFVQDMRSPRDFPKALYLSSAVVLISFAIFGGTIYGLTGTQYMTIPAIGTLRWKYKIIVFSLMVPTIVFLGALYAAVLARRTHAKISHAVCARYPKFLETRGHFWSLWVAVLFTVWGAAWLVAGLIPFFSGLTSIVAAIFVSYFGFIIPPFAWSAMQAADVRNGSSRRKGQLAMVQRIFWVGMIFFGACIMCGLGLYASTWNLIDEFRETGIGRPFACHRGCGAEPS